MLEARDVTVRFGGLTAVDHVSLTVSPASVLGLVGPNGSGKSTFLNAVTGVVEADGVVLLDGARLPLGNPRKVRMRGVLRTYQTAQTFHALSCIENVLLATPEREGAGLVGSWLVRPRMWRAERRRWDQAAAALDRVGLLKFAEDSSSQLTYGQQRLLEIARAMAAEPRMLLLDEPAAGLNEAETRQLSELLESLRDEGVGLLLVDHKIDFISSVSDRIAVLNLGQVIAEGSSDEVWKDARVMDAYLGAVESEGAEGA